MGRAVVVVCGRHVVYVTVGITFVDEMVMVEKSDFVEAVECKLWVCFINVESCSSKYVVKRV